MRMNQARLVPAVIVSVLLWVSLTLALPETAFGQQRPLLTQDPKLVEPGNVSLQFGFDFLQNATFPASGLKGDLTSLGVTGLYIGLGERAEFQMEWTIFHSLSINERSATPLDLQLNLGGTATSDFGDVVLSTKILLVPEEHKRPSLAFRPSVQLPNSSAAKGLGLDSTQFFGTLLAGKHLGRLNTFGNLGLGILSNPVQAGVQNDVLIYGVGGIFPLSPKFNLASEVFGRWSTRNIPLLGTESLSQFRLGLQIFGLGFRWDLAGIAGLAHNSPRSGITFGVSRELKAFRPKPRGN